MTLIEYLRNRTAVFWVAVGVNAAMVLALARVLTDHPSYWYAVVVLLLVLVNGAMLRGAIRVGGKVWIGCPRCDFAVRFTGNMPALHATMVAHIRETHDPAFVDPLEGRK